ncbi:MAG: hypothetical protein ACYDHX_04425 [Methanothrix sp.]
MMDTSSNFTRPALYVETVDLLGEILYYEDFAVAKMGPRMNLVLPKEVGRMLDAYVGHRLSILKTDLPDKPFLAIEIDAQGKMIGSIIPSKENGIPQSRSTAISKDFNHEESTKVELRDMTLYGLDRRFSNFDRLDLNLVRSMINGFRPEGVMN